MSSDEFSSSSSIKQENVELAYNEDEMPEAIPNNLPNLYADEAEQQDHVYVADPEQKDLYFNPDAYDCFLRFNLDWPLLSLDFINIYSQDQQLQENRPFYIVGGSYTDASEKPAVSVIYLSNVQDYAPGDDPEQELENYDIEPVFYRRIFDVRSNITRVKSDTQFLYNKYVTGNAGIIGFWQESGVLSFVGVDYYLKSLSAFPGALNDYNSSYTCFLYEENGWCGYYPVALAKTQVFYFDSPGYALDFHSTQHLAICGNYDNVLAAFYIAQDGKIHRDASNYSHFAAGSIEDVHFAHTGYLLVNSVFGAVSTTGEFYVVDPRVPSAKSVYKISDVDINVFDFDYADENVVYFGDDAGIVRSYDLRAMYHPIVSIKYHTTPITSLKAQPCTAGLVATSDDSSVCFWQFDAEDDENAAILREQHLPQQFLFLHLGAEEVKEISWCGREIGYLVIADLNGMQIIRPINLCD